MRVDLLRRIEKLEATNPIAAERKRVALRFVGAKDGKPVNEMPERASRMDGTMAIIRSANEAAEAFERRAFDHFSELDAAPWPLIVLFK